jgi:hypothetical protein
VDSNPCAQPELGRNGGPVPLQVAPLNPGGQTHTPEFVHVPPFTHGNGQLLKQKTGPPVQAPVLLQVSGPPANVVPAGHSIVT